MTTESTGEKPTRVDWVEVHRRMALNQATIDQGLKLGEREKSLILKQRAKILAREPERRETADFIDLVTFLVADEKYGVESQYVKEVYALKELTPVPCTPAFVLGITDVRGKIISVIDIKKFFDLPPKGLNELDKIVIVEFSQLEIGIRADMILGVQRVASHQIQSGLPTLTGVREKYLKGVTTESLVILDLPKLLSDPDIIVNEEVKG